MMLLYFVTSLRYGRYSERLPERLGEGGFDISEEKNPEAALWTHSWFL